MSFKKKAAKKPAKKKIKLRPEPEAPVRQTRIEERFELSYGYGGTNLQQIVDWAAQWETPLDQVIFDSEYWYGSEEDTHFRLIREETDLEFKARLKAYEKQLNEYRQWQKDNKAAIEEVEREKAEKEKERVEKKRQRAEKELARLEKEVERKRKELEKNSK